MRDAIEIIPETKPGTEWVRGRALQNVSPKPRHSVLQLWLGQWLRAWAAGSGD